MGGVNYSAGALVTRGNVPTTADHAVGTIVNVLGVLYELVADTDEPNILRGTSRVFDNNYNGIGARNWSDPAYPGIIRWLNPTASASPGGLRRVDIRLPKRVIATPPATLYVRLTDLDTHYVQDVVVPQDTSRSFLNSWYWAIAATGSGTWSDAAAGERVQFEFFTDVGFSTPLKVHGVNRWEYWNDRAEPDETAAWALRRNTDEIPASKLPDIPVAKLPHYANLFTELHDAPTAISIARGTSAVQQAMTAFSPAFTLAGTEHGVMLVTAEWSIASGSTSQLSLPDDVHETNQLTLSALRATEAYGGGSSDKNGLVAASTELYNAADPPVLQGTVSLRIAKDASSPAVVGFYMDYEPNDATAVVGTVGTVNVGLQVTLLRTDATAAGGGAFALGDVVVNAQFSNTSTARELTTAEKALLNAEPILDWYFQWFNSSTQRPPTAHIRKDVDMFLCRTIDVGHTLNGMRHIGGAMLQHQFLSAPLKVGIGTHLQIQNALTGANLSLADIGKYNIVARKPS